MGYSMNMNEERPPQVLLKEGYREFTIVAAREQKSKAGNEMFVATFKDIETQDQIDVYLVATPGKRWVLKTLLNGLGIKKDESGAYNFELSDLVGKNVQGLVKNQNEEWINREGNTVNTLKSKVTEFSPSQIAWDENLTQPMFKE